MILWIEFIFHLSYFHVHTDFDLSIFQKRYNASLKIMMFTMNNSSVTSHVKWLVTDGNTEFFIMFASGHAIRDMLQTVSI